jgi:hypothetical protein
MTDIVGGTEVSTDTPDDSSLVDFISALGPKRVKTKAMEIEAHSPEVAQRILERRARKKVGITRIPFNIAVPLGGCDCGDC